jgi:hypothetical protein
MDRSGAAGPGLQRRHRPQPGRTKTAGRQQHGAGGNHGPGDLIDFRFYGRPTTLPLGLWVEIFEGLDLSAGLIRDENSREEAVRRLQSVVQAN